MKTQTSRQFLNRLASRRLARALSLALVGASALMLSQAAQAVTYVYSGGTTGVWTTPTVWTPNGVPGSADIASFTGSAAQQVLLGGAQSALGLSFTASANTSSVRGNAATGQVLSLGTSGIIYGSTQTDLGGGSTSAIAISLMGSQSWTGSGSGLIQLDSGNPTAQAITNGTSGAVTLTFDGAGTGTKTIGGIIDNGALGGTTAITYAQTGTSFGALVLNAANTFSGGVTFNQGYQLTLNNAAALGTGTLTIGGSALSATVLRNIGTTVTGGVTLNNNAQAWNADFTLNGAQNLNFGTGAVTLGGNRTIILNATSNPVTFTEGGAISGAFSLSTTTLPAGSTGYTPGINSTLVLSGANTYTGGTNINFGLVNFANAAAIPATGQVTLNGGALAVGTGTAFPTLAAVAANTSVTRTSGSLALTASSAENFTAPNTAISLGAALGSVVNYTGTITPSGNNYNLGGGGGTIIFSNDGAFTGARSITTNGGTQTNTAGGGGTVIITGQNSNTGNGGTGVNVGLGTLEVSSINSVVGGTATSNLGAPTTALAGTINFGGTGSFSQLRYTGAGETTDRNLNFAGFSGATASFDASGTGPLNFSTTTYTQASASSKNLILRGINTGANTIAAGIGTQAVNPGANTLTKQQRGNWTLSGSNNFSAVTITGGTLTADYTNVATVFTTSTPTLTLGGGNLAIRGNAAGTTNQTIGNLTTTNSTGQDQITVTGNGSANSANLTIGSTFTRGTNDYVNFNLLSGGTVTSSPTVTAGLIGPTGQASYTVTDSTSTDFATITGGKVAKLGAPDGALPTTGGSGTANYSLSGNVTLSGNVAANTTRIDTSGGGGTLTLGSNNITGGTGEILMSGASDYTISGTSIRTSGGTVGLSNYGPGKLTVAASATNSTGGLNKTGPGLVDLTAAQTYTGNTNILGGVLRVSNSSFATSIITLSTGGILEIGADLNGATAGDFSRTVNSGGSGQINWANGDGGFSAFAGNRTVSLTNAQNVANGQLVWGSSGGNNFVVQPNASGQFVRDGFALLLSSSTSDSTVELTNPIDFVNVPRAVVVGDGSAAVDAVLSGVLSSSDFSGGLHKNGAGTLALTNNNTYTGATAVNTGVLLVNNTPVGGVGSGTGSGAVSVSTAATLGGTGRISGAVTVNTGATLLGGDGVSSSGALTLATNPTLSTGSILSVVLGAASAHSTINLAGGFNGFDPNQAFTLVSTQIGNFDNIITGVAANIVTTGWTITNANGFSYTFTDDGNNIDLSITAVPEPSTWVGSGLMIVAIAWSQRKRFGARQTV